MPKSNGVSGYNLHKSSGQPRVIINGKHFYLGEFGSPKSKEEYGRLLCEFQGLAPF